MVDSLEIITEQIEEVKVLQAYRCPLLNKCYKRENFFESAIPKVTWSQLCWGFFSTVTKHIDNSILKDTLKLKILWTWIKIRANYFIKTLVNIMKRKSTKVPWKLSLVKKINTPHFKEHCTKIDDISLVVIRFFFSQTNLVFKSNPVFIDILDSFCHNLFTFLPLDFYLYSRDFEVHPIHVRLSTKTSKVLMRFSVLFVRFSSSKCACVLFSIKHSYLWTWNCC